MFARTKGRPMTNETQQWLVAWETEIKKRGLRIKAREPMEGQHGLIIYRYIWTDGTKHWQARIWEPFTTYPENNSTEQISELVDHYMNYELYPVPKEQRK